MTSGMSELNLQVFQDPKKREAYIEIGTIPLVTFFYFRKKTFEILDEEILELISRDPSNTFLYEKSEDIYSLDDGAPI